MALEKKIYKCCQCILCYFNCSLYSIGPVNFMVVVGNHMHYILTPFSVIFMRMVYVSKKINYNAPWGGGGIEIVISVIQSKTLTLLTFSTMHACYIDFIIIQWYSLWQELSIGTNILTLWLPSPWSLTNFKKKLNNANNCWTVRVRVLIFHTSYTCDKFVDTNISDPWPWLWVCPTFLFITYRQ